MVAMKSTLVGRSYLLFVKTNSIIVIIFGWMRIIQSSPSNNVQYIPVFSVHSVWSVAAAAASVLCALFYCRSMVWLWNVFIAMKIAFAKLTGKIYTQASAYVVSYTLNRLSCRVIRQNTYRSNTQYKCRFFILCDPICVRIGIEANH